MRYIKVIKELKRVLLEFLYEDLDSLPLEDALEITRLYKFQLSILLCNINVIKGKEREEILGLARQIIKEQQNNQD